MKVYKETTAWNQLQSFAEDDWEYVGDLVKFILDNNLEDEFNTLMETEYFKDGVGEDEFKAFINQNAESLEIQLKRIMMGCPIKFN